MFCINCGKQLEEGSRFCPYCGAKVPDLTASAPGESGNPTGQTGGADSGAFNPFQQQNPASGEAGGDPGQTDYWSQFAGSNPGQPGTVYQDQPGTGDPGQTGADPWGQPTGGDPGQTGTGSQGQAYGGYQNFNQNQNQNKGGFDPWSMKGGPTQTGSTVQGDPWGSQGGAGVAAAPTKPPKKKHTVRNIILIVVGVIVLALVGLFILGSTLLGKYEPLVKSYLSYAEQSDVQRVESLFYPEIVDNYHMIFGDTEAIYYLDSWTDNYGQKVDRFEISEMDDEDDELQYFNELYGVQATEYVDVTVMVYYDSGRYSCMDFDMVHIDGSWYLAYIW